MESKEKIYKGNVRRIITAALLIFILLMAGGLFFDKYMLNVLSRQSQENVQNVLLQQTAIVDNTIRSTLLNAENSAKILENMDTGYYDKYLERIDFGSAAVIVDMNGKALYGNSIDAEIAYDESLVYYRSKDDSIVFCAPFATSDAENAALLIEYSSEDIRNINITDAFNGYARSFIVDESGSISLALNEYNESMDLSKAAIDFEKMPSVYIHDFESGVIDGQRCYLAMKKLETNDWYMTLKVPYTAAVSGYYEALQLISISHLIILLIFIGLFMYIEISNQKNALRMYRVAYTDKMTGLPTWNKLQEDVIPLLSQEDKKTSYALVVVDIDDFKTINQLLGYSTGNNIICTVAEYIKNSIREDEYVCRLTGDCFFAALIHDDKDEAIAERLYKTLEHATVASENKKLSIGFTCGVNRIYEDSLESMLDGAIIAKNHPNPAYHGKIGFYDEHVRKKTLESKELESSLEASLANKEFLVYLQPKYSFKTGELTGAEALVRWNHPKRGMISPGIFIPIFEANGNIDKIDGFVFETICGKLREWIDNGIRMLPISVNLSRLEIISGNIGEILANMVKKYNVPFDLLDLELTETVAFTDSERLMETMTMLKDMGFKLSIDDFGSGYSSLSLLEQMPFDTLKLDRSFIMGWDSNSDQRRKECVVEGIITMAKHLNITTLMEGVETKEQSDFLRVAGCDLVQGYYYGRPMPIEDYEKLLASVSVS